MTLAEKIVYFREKDRLSQGELAERLNVTRQAISKWENGQATPEIENLVRMSRLFGVTVDALLTDGADCPAGEVPEKRARLVGRAEVLSYLSVCQKNAVWRAVGLFLCILAPVLLLIFAGISGMTDAMEDHVAVGIGLCLCALTIAAAVADFLLCDGRFRPFSYFEDEPIALEGTASELLKAERERVESVASRCEAFGMVLSVLSMLPMFVTVLLGESDLWMLFAVCLTFLIVGCAGGLLVFAGARRDGVDRALRIGDYTEEGRARHHVLRALGVGYWLVVIAVFLTLEFVVDIPLGKSWVLFPIAGVLYLAAMTVLRAVFSKKK